MSHRMSNRSHRELHRNDKTPHSSHRELHNNHTGPHITYRRPERNYRRPHSNHSILTIAIDNPIAATGTAQRVPQEPQSTPEELQ